MTTRGRNDPGQPLRKEKQAMSLHCSAACLDLSVPTIQSLIRDGMLEECTIGHFGPRTRWVTLRSMRSFVDSLRKQSGVNANAEGAHGVPAIASAPNEGKDVNE